LVPEARHRAEPLYITLQGELLYRMTQRSDDDTSCKS